MSLDDRTQRLRSIDAEASVAPGASNALDMRALDHPSIEFDVRVPIQVDTDIVVAHKQGRALAARIGFSGSNLTIIATAISEIARNIVTHAFSGEIRMTQVDDGRRVGLRVVASDSGPGIPDIAVAMRDGYSTGQGLGIGLSGSRRLMDDFEIESIVGQGTIVTMTKWVS